MPPDWVKAALLTVALIGLLNQFDFSSGLLSGSNRFFKF